MHHDVHAPSEHDATQDARPEPVVAPQVPAHRSAAPLVGRLLALLLALTIAGCAPPAPHDHDHHHDRGRGRPHGATTAPSPRVTDVFPDGTAESAVRYWHDNPELMPQVLDDSTLLLDAAGAGASRVPLPAESAYESLVVVLTCARPIAYTISLVPLAPLGALGAPEALTSSGASCGGPTIALFSPPPLDLSSTTAEIDVDVPGDTAYYLAVYRRSAPTPSP